MINVLHGSRPCLSGTGLEELAAVSSSWPQNMESEMARMKMVDEGKSYLTEGATQEQKDETMDAALAMLMEAREKDLPFFIGVFKEVEGKLGLEMTGRGTPRNMAMMAECLIDKAETTPVPPMEPLLDLLQDIFGEDAVRVIDENTDFSKLDLPLGEEEVEQVPVVTAANPIDWGAESDEVAALHEEMPKHKHPDEK